MLVDVVSTDDGGWALCRNMQTRQCDEHTCLSFITLSTMCCSVLADPLPEDTIYFL